jgi:hypothetical protein
MPLSAPVTCHCDLFRYWLAKRGGRRMPSRSDLNPAEIPHLLPHLSLVHWSGGRLCYRLVGTAIVEQLGRDLTGKPVGFYVSDGPGTAEAPLQALGKRVFTTARPVFMTAGYETKQGVLYRSSALLLPLSAGGTEAKMIVFSRIACFSSQAGASRDWLAGVPFKIQDAIDIESEEELLRLSLDWERDRLPVNA